MKKQKKKSGNRLPRRAFTLWKPLFWGSLMITALAGLAWYVLLPTTQYRLRRALIQRKYPDANQYRRPVFPLQFAESSPVQRTYYLYRLSTSQGTLAEIYRKEDAPWRTSAIVSDGVIYVADGKALYALRGTSGEKEKMYEISGDNTALYLVNSADDGVYTVRFNDETDYSQDMQVSKFNPVQKTVNSFATLRPGIYESPSMVIPGEYPTLITGGGDGCGGGHRVLQYRDGDQKQIAWFGEGCAEGPRYIGVMNDTTKLLAASPLSPIDGENGPFYCNYDVLYSHDIKSGGVMPIIDMKPIPGCIRDMTYDRVTNHAAIVTDATIYIVDVAKAAVVKTLANADAHPYNFSQYGGLLVSYTDEPGDKHITVTDIMKEASVDVSWDYRYGRFPSFVGRIGDDILISTYETRTR